ncbi:MAG: hypothetical protein GY720_15925 [bacterium]|nr:hypothetical protein [bacterium]
MARLRSKGIQGQSANTTGAQLRARGGELIAGGIASAFGAVGGAVQNKKAREAAQAEAEKSRRNALLIEGERSRQKQLDRESREGIATLNAKARVAAKLVGDSKATQAKAAAAFEEMKELQSIASEAEGRGGKIPTEVENRISVLKAGLGGLANMLNMTQSRMQAEGVKEPAIESVPQLQDDVAKLESERLQLKSALSRLEKNKSPERLKSTVRRRITDRMGLNKKASDEAGARAEFATQQSKERLAGVLEQRRRETEVRQLVTAAKDNDLPFKLVQSQIENIRDGATEDAEDAIRFVEDERDRLLANDRAAEAKALADKATAKKIEGAQSARASFKSVAKPDRHASQEDINTVAKKIDGPKDINGAHEELAKIRRQNAAISEQRNKHPLKGKSFPMTKDEDSEQMVLDLSAISGWSDELMAASLVNREQGDARRREGLEAKYQFSKMGKGRQAALINKLIGKRPVDEEEAAKAELLRISGLDEKDLESPGALGVDAAEDAARADPKRAAANQAVGFAMNDTEWAEYKRGLGG